MPGTPAILGVFVIGLLMVLTPGPNMVYLVSRAITQGRRAGAVSLAGVALGFLVYLARSRLAAAPLRDGVVHEPPEPEGGGDVPLSLIPQFERPEAGHLVFQGFVLGSV